MQLIGVLGSFTFVPSVTLFLLHFYTGRVLFNLDNFVGQFFSQYFSGSCHYACGFREIRSSRVHCDTAALARATGKRSDFLKLTFRVNVGPRTYQEPCRVF